VEFLKFRKILDSILCIFNIYHINLILISRCAKFYVLIHEKCKFHACQFGRDCNIVYNNWRKTAKIGSGWRYFAAETNLEANQEFIFEFPNGEDNFTLLLIII